MPDVLPDSRFERHARSQGPETPPAPAAPRLHALVARLGELSFLDRGAKPAAKAVRSGIGPGPVKDALSGRALGHALHPLLTDLPIGAWTSAVALDLVGGRESRKASRRLIGLGVAAAVPTALTGLTDWADTEPADDEVRRVGVIHAVANSLALGLFSASWRARGRGDHGRGVGLGLAGATALAAGGHLGGHLSYAKAVGVSATALGKPLDDWTDACDSSDLREGRLHHYRAGGHDLLLVREGEEIHALADRCSHRGGALHQGELSDGCVTCPLHGSRFRLADGSVERGPAAYPQPTYSVRVTDGRVQVRSAHNAPTV